MRKLKGIQTVLAIVISLFILVFLAYIHHYSLTGADFLSSTVSYQNLDQESTSVESLNKSKTFTSSSTCYVSLPGTNLSVQPLHLVPPNSFLQKRTSVLRC
jgi:uncharacterized protein YpmB